MRRIFRLLNRRKWLLIAPVVLAVAIAALVLSRVTPEYGATATIVVEGGQSKGEATAAVPGSPLESSGRVVSDVDLVLSASLLGQVVDKFELEKDSEFGMAPSGTLARWWAWTWEQLRELLDRDSPDHRHAMNALSPRAKALEVLTSSVSATTRPPSALISVTVRSMDRRKAERIATAVADTFLIDKARAKADASRRASEFFEGRLANLRRDVDTAEGALISFRATHGSVVGDGRTTVAQTLSELNSQLSLARMQTAERESRLKALQRAQSTPAARAGLAEILANPVISGLQLQEAEVARRVADLTQRYGDNYPRVPEAKAELAQIQGRISAEIAKIVVSLQGDIDAAHAKEGQLKEQVDGLEHQAADQRQAAEELRRIQDKRIAAQAAYDEMLKRSNEFQERLAMGQPEARVLSAASASEVPVYPRYGRTLYLSALAGLLVGLIWIVTVERLDNGFRSAEQVERLTGRPLIGMIPLLRRSAVKRSSAAKLVLAKPMSVYAEALRSTQTAVALSAGERSPRVIMITSSVPGEGKSTFASSMATLMARSNPTKKVVLVDCDLRRASVGQLLGVSSVSGTIDQYLVGKESLDRVFGRASDSGLYYVLSHTDTPNSSELLASLSMRAFVEALADQFDLVVLDTPPLMAVSDPRVIAQFVDYVIFLVRWEKTDRSLALNALRLLAETEADVGIVLSQVDLKRHSRYGYHDYGAYYSKYHDYYSS